MSVYVVPLHGAERARAWRSDGDTILCVPITPMATDPEERARRASEVGDLLTEDERRAIFAAYEVSSRDELLSSTAPTCPVCGVPQALRPPNVPWPPCPEHGTPGDWRI